MPWTNFPSDNLEDQLIHRFNKSEPCTAGQELLKSQILLNSADDVYNPLKNPIITDLDVENGCNINFILDKNMENDGEVDVEGFNCELML